MSASVMDRVLSVEEVRRRFKTVNAAALHHKALIHYGERGTDQLVIISVQTLAALLERAQTVATQASPYAGFTQALVEGRLGRPVGAAAVPQGRRRLPDAGAADSTVPVATMVVAGADASPPRRRRPASS
jgi:hypothetical protein